MLAYEDVFFVLEVVVRLHNERMVSYCILRVKNIPVTAESSLKLS